MSDSESDSSHQAPSEPSAHSEHSATSQASPEESTHWWSLIHSLANLSHQYPDYAVGKLPLPSSAFDLYYQDTDGIPQLINLATASEGQLDALTRACKPASFGRDAKDVLDETYRKAGKLDATAFSTPIVPERTDLARIVRDFLLEGESNKTAITMELYKLNVYGKGSFFKEHVDTPRAKQMLASLVLVFPTPHRGGEFVLRVGEEKPYTFDSSGLLAPGELYIGYAAFFSDVSHEVLPVTEGHRVTLTFNLYVDDLDPDIPMVPQNESTRMAQCAEVLTQMLQDKRMMPDGGLLGFALRHAYPISAKHKVSSTRKALKGMDRLLWNMLKRLGVAPSMHLLYEYPDRWSSRSRTRHSPDLNESLDSRGLVNEVLDLDRLDEEEFAVDVINRKSTLKAEGITVPNVVWVTSPNRKLSRIEQPHTTYGNEAATEWAYANLCLVARVKPYADRVNTASDSDEPTS